ncbi:MAG: fimbrillin family protein [Bacteroidaceae bacterium]|nr:fimbrillin family protein [Bacteroidaceae bacterium]
MKKYLFMAVAAIAALSSCSSDNEVFNSEVKKALTFTATMEGIGGDTRATLDNLCAKWEEGDKIYIMGIDASNIATEASYVASGANGTSTTFEPATPGQEVSGQTFRAFFPTYILDGGACVIPAEIDETWAEGKFNMPMFAMSNTTTLAFQNLCGVLAIKVNKDQLERVEFITISSSNRKLNGWIQPMPNSEGKLRVGLVSPEKDDDFDDLAIHYTSVVEIGEEGNVFYVPIPPSYNLDIDLNTRTMSLVADPYKDLKILLNDGKGHIKSMTTKKDKEILIERNKIYNITFKDNTPPTTGTAKAKINGVDVDVNWVQLWAGGPKFAE